MSFQCHTLSELFFSLFAYFFMLVVGILCVQCHEARKYPYAIFNVNFFISHKKDIIFAWPCKYSAINLGSLTCDVATQTHFYAHTKFRSFRFLTLLRNNFNFIQFSVFSSQWCPSALYTVPCWEHPFYISFYTYICLCMKWSAVYLVKLIPSISIKKLRFYFAFASDAIQKVACHNMVVC